MLEALLINAAVDLAMMLGLCWVAVRIGDVSFIDAVWGAGMVVLAAASWLQIAPAGERAGLLFMMTAVWGLRLGVHLFLSGANTVRIRVMPGCWAKRALPGTMAARRSRWCSARRRCCCS